MLKISRIQRWLSWFLNKLRSSGSCVDPMVHIFKRDAKKVSFLCWPETFKKTIIKIISCTQRIQSLHLCRILSCGPWLCIACCDRLFKDKTCSQLFTDGPEATMVHRSYLFFSQSFLIPFGSLCDPLMAWVYVFKHLDSDPCGHPFFHAHRDLCTSIHGGVPTELSLNICHPSEVPCTPRRLLSQWPEVHRFG